MDPFFWLLVIAVLGLGWLLLRQKKASGRAPDGADAANYLTPKPVEEEFRVAGWDGFSGMQMALAVELSDERCFPLIQAGIQPPASRTQTFSTAGPDQQYLTLSLYAGLFKEVRRVQRVEKLVIGPIPVTGEAIREIEVTFSVDSSGQVTVTAETAQDATPVACEVVEAYRAAIPVGRRDA